MTTDESQDWAAATYDRSAGYVSRFGEDVVDLLDPKPGEKILDLGCGTGDLTQEISTRGARVTGIDASPQMISRAAGKYPDLRFEVGDAKGLEGFSSFDAVFSNAVLHWVREARQVISAVYSALNLGGRFVAELGGRGNVRCIESALQEALAERGISAADRNPWYFPSLAQYAALLEEGGFEATYAVLFDRPTPIGGEGIERWLEVFAGNFLDGLSEDTRREVVGSVAAKVRPELLTAEGWVADYRRLRVCAVRR